MPDLAADCDRVLMGIDRLPALVFWSIANGRCECDPMLSATVIGGSEEIDHRLSCSVR
jgi:hypothetical protein